ncbi:hypothetical protein NCCP2716_06090 [Sporosarcina sp. NCCP-2716]|uniref:hypothetical protein n=1 Tax=Sporosarcina sp. NCCP-2716 TaxID=2943679 RepID=UPI00203E1B88|nr:hypothetical protein [Sporosarcina sp. NCCP-2716]GKV68111.1 hypothetical protein NCCP2716_06090 [Sporosarcina sp. NCCP-2716]
MEGAYGVFLTGVLLISVLSSVLLLLLPESRHEEFAQLAKLAAGMWLLFNLISLFRL